MGRFPTKTFCESKFFYRKTFRGRGEKKSMILGLFSKTKKQIVSWANFDAFVVQK